MPKKKFAFKSRKKESSNPAPKSAVAKEGTSLKAVTALSKQSKVGFKNRSHESVLMSVSHYKQS